MCWLESSAIPANPSQKSNGLSEAALTSRRSRAFPPVILRLTDSIYKTAGCETRCRQQRYPSGLIEESMSVSSPTVKSAKLCTLERLIAVRPW